MDRKQMETHLTLLGWEPMVDHKYSLSSGFAYELWGCDGTLTLTLDFSMAEFNGDGPEDREDWNAAREAREKIVSTPWATLPDAAVEAFFAAVVGDQHG